MGNWKKRAGLILALALAASALAGCSNKTASSASSAPSEVSSAAESSSAPQVGAGIEGVHYGAGLTDKGTFEGVKALDYVELPDYKGIEVPESVAMVSDSDVDARINTLLGSSAVRQVKDRAVRDGDTVNIDYVGSVDGVEFAGGNTQGGGTTVTIGVTNYIDDFLQQLIGHMPGDTFDVNVTFPDPYQSNTDLSGKDAVFVTTINYIEEPEEPTDAMVKETFGETKGWTTVDQMKEGVRQELRDNAVSSYVWGQIQEKAKVSETPETVMTFYDEAVRSNYAMTAYQQGMELEDFLTQYAGVESLDELVEKNYSTLEKNAAASLVLQALCEDMGFEVAEEDVKAYLLESVAEENLANLENVYGKPYLFLMAREALVKRELAKLG